MSNNIGWKVAAALAAAMLSATPARARGASSPLEALRVKIEAFRAVPAGSGITGVAPDPSTGLLKVFVLPGQEGPVRRACAEKLSAPERALVVVEAQAGPRSSAFPEAEAGHREAIAQGLREAESLMQATAAHPVFQSPSPAAAALPEITGGSRPNLTVSAPPRRRGHNVPPTPEELRQADKIDWEKVRAAMREQTQEGERFKQWAGLGGSGVATLVIGVSAGFLGIGCAPVLLVGGALLAVWGYGNAWKSARKITKGQDER